MDTMDEQQQIEERMKVEKKKDKKLVGEDMEDADEKLKDAKKKVVTDVSGK